MIQFDQFPKPIIFAHRGSSNDAPENTIAAFNLAVKQKADFIELDVQLSADGQPVVFHDNALNRTAGVSGQVTKLPLSELKKLDVGSSFDISFRGETIPTLGEVFEAVGNSIFINIELKNLPTLNDQLPKKVAGEVSRHDMAERVIFSSFNPLALLEIKRLIPGAPIGLLIDTNPMSALSRPILERVIPHQALHPYYKDVTYEMIKRIHQQDKWVFTWTVDDAEEMRKLIAMGIDGLFTNNPGLGLEVRKDIMVRNQR